jgi:hypothetical protein
MMSVWRSLASLAIFLIAVPMAWPQTVSLVEDVKTGDCFAVRLNMELGGEILVTKDGKAASIRLSTSASHDFVSKVLEVADGAAAKIAIVYEKAHSEIRVGGDKSDRTLRPNRKLVVAQRDSDQPLVYSPSGPLTREELELVGEHFDTLTLTGLLPGKAVSKGDSWKVKNSVVQALCNFEGLTEQDLTCKLVDANEKTATVTVTGQAAGIDLGAQVKLTVDATYTFDLAAKRLVSLMWKQKDERAEGPANPASNVNVATTVERKPIEQPKVLSDASLASVPDDFDPPKHLTHVEYRDSRNRFEIIFGREWQTVGQTEDHLILRLMERGDFVAQVTITPWTSAEKGKHLSPEEFKDAMASTPGWEPAEELQAGEIPAGEGKWAYRISAQGKMYDVTVVQNFYLVAGPNGEQTVLAFTMTPKQVERLGTRDLSLVGSLEYPKK